jgi:hypothetical protein
MKIPLADFAAITAEMRKDCYSIDIAELKDSQVLSFNRFTLTPFTPGLSAVFTI